MEKCGEEERCLSYWVVSEKEEQQGAMAVVVVVGSRLVSVVEMARREKSNREGLRWWSCWCA